MDEINWSNEFYSDMFSIHFDSRFSTVDLESLEIKENRKLCEVENTMNQTSERVVRNDCRNGLYRWQTSPGSLLLQASYLKRHSNRQKIKSQTDV